MQFTVPQFIEKKPKIVGPFTFEQFIFVFSAAGVCFFLYFVLPFSLFIIFAILLGFVSLSLAFVKVQGVPLPTVLKNFLIYLLSPKIFLWRRKVSHPKFTQVKREVVKEEKKERDLKMSENSRLKNLSSYIETKSK